MKLALTALMVIATLFTVTGSAVADGDGPMVWHVIDEVPDTVPSLWYPDEGLFCADNTVYEISTVSTSLVCEEAPTADGLYGFPELDAS